MIIRPIHTVFCRLLPLLAVMSLVHACGISSSNKRNRSQACGPDFKSGTSQTVTLYRSDRVPYGASCEPLAFQTIAACNNGTPAYLQSGSPTCEAAELELVSVKSDRLEMEVGETLQMSLEGKDQWGGTFPLDVKLAAWSTSNDNIQVDQEGRVTATAGAPTVSIAARYPGFNTATLELSVREKGCGGVAHGTEEVLPRYKAAKVPFNQTCELIEVKATCERGLFRLAEGFETCEVSKLVALEADPGRLYLNKGESATVKLEVVDELGTRAAVAADQAVWTDLSPSLQLAGATITNNEDLMDEAHVTVSAQGFTTKISVMNPKSKPESLWFAETNLVLKKGDEKNLEVKGKVRGDEVTIEAELLSWESSNPTAVSVVNGLVKALVPNSEATLTARLGDFILSAAVSVEADLGIELKLQGDALITKDILRIRPVATLIVKGPLKDQKPSLSPAAVGCSFELQKNRGKWEIDVTFDPNVSPIPAACSTELSAESQAGQSVKQLLSVPIRYSFFTFTEIVPGEFKTEPFPIAKLSYKLTEGSSVSSYTVTKFKNTDLSPAGCELSLAEVDGGLEVRAAFSDLTLTSCAGYLKLTMLTNGTESEYLQLVLASKEPTFEEQCQKPLDSESEQTIALVRKAVAPTATCEKLADIIRVKNFESAYYSNRVFTLSLANKGIKSLVPLARLVGLRELVLTRNKELSDISPLANLKLLSILHLKGTAVSDVTLLRQHRQMDDLRINSGIEVACSPDLSNPSLLSVCK